MTDNYRTNSRWYHRPDPNIYMHSITCFTQSTKAAENSSASEWAVS